MFFALYAVNLKTRTCTLKQQCRESQLIWPRCVLGPRDSSQVFPKLPFSVKQFFAMAETIKWTTWTKTYKFNSRTWPSPQKLKSSIHTDYVWAFAAFFGDTSAHSTSVGLPAVDTLAIVTGFVVPSPVPYSHTINLTIFEAASEVCWVSFWTKVLAKSLFT